MTFPVKLTPLLPLLAALLVTLFGGCGAGHSEDDAPSVLLEPLDLPASAQSAYFAAGCFWCTEEIFQQAPGVISVVSGYMGGSEPNPTYEQVGSGATGHAESVRVAFDPALTSYEKLLETFWHAHDPTQLNRQGPDIGRQYRSAIFPINDEQLQAARQSLAALETAGTYSKPIATEITPGARFYTAEKYHQNYYRSHPTDPYLLNWLVPKLKKLGLKYY